MSKIAIISQPDHGVLIDVGGCTTLQEATHHLTSTLQISSQFWNGLNIELNLGSLELTAQDVAQILSIAAEVGIKPNRVFAQNEATAEALKLQSINVGIGDPISLPSSSAAAELSEVDEELTLVDYQDKSARPQDIQLGAQLPDEGPGDYRDTTDGASLEKPATPAAPLQVLYLRQTLRSGQAVSHKGHLVIVGDVNPGAEVMADGDITIWGALRGMAHAGVSGNTDAQIRALRLQPIQIRIAHAIARSPDQPRKGLNRHAGPETARIVNGTIRIAANNPE